ncbi:hypothetical protein EPN28_02450 [Patescibacteria group bacterium]|nr:MAG: hypothetical protein EPN28_02450 [Patescibacteria group bacterium]
MNTLKLREYKKGLKLTKVQREILVGTLLGDSHLSNHNSGVAYRLMVQHGLSQKAYVDWIYDKFKDWVITPPKIKDQTVNGKLYKKYWFNTVSHPALRFYAAQFYRGREKTVPKLIHRWLTPLGLAVWFMDDGSIKSNHHRALILNTQCYSDICLRRLRRVLSNKYKIATKLRKQKEGKQIYLLASSVQEFVNIIRPYIIPKMEYKLGKLR